MGIIKLSKINRNKQSIEQIQNKVLRTNNFTSVDEPENSSPALEKPDDTTFIIDDLNNDEADIHYSVDLIKNQVLKVVRQQKLKTQYLKMLKFKLRMIEVIKARRDRKHFRNVKLAVRVIQKHFKIILKRRVNSNQVVDQVKDHERYKKLKQMQFLQKQRQLTNKRKMRKQVGFDFVIIGCLGY